MRTEVGAAGGSTVAAENGASDNGRLAESGTETHARWLPPSGARAASPSTARIRAALRHPPASYLAVALAAAVGVARSHARDRGRLTALGRRLVPHRVVARVGRARAADLAALPIRRELVLPDALVARVLGALPRLRPVLRADVPRDRQPDPRDERPRLPDVPALRARGVRARAALGRRSRGGDRGVPVRVLPAARAIDHPLPPARHVRASARDPLRRSLARARTQPRCVGARGRGRDPVPLLVLPRLRARPLLRRRPARASLALAHAHRSPPLDRPRARARRRPRTGRSPRRSVSPPARARAHPALRRASHPGARPGPVLRVEGRERLLPERQRRALRLRARARGAAAAVARATWRDADRDRARRLGRRRRLRSRAVRLGQDGLVAVPGASPHRARAVRDPTSVALLGDRAARAGAPRRARRGAPPRARSGARALAGGGRAPRARRVG